MGAGKSGERLIEEQTKRLGVFLELILARLDVREDVTESAVLRFVPTGADPTVGAPT